MVILVSVLLVVVYVAFRHDMKKVRPLADYVKTQPEVHQALMRVPVSVVSKWSVDGVSYEEFSSVIDRYL